MLICSMVLQCASTLKPWFHSEPVTADLATTVVYYIAINYQEILSNTIPDVFIQHYIT